MAENVGGIVWTAEMKTEQLVGAEKTITNTLNKTDQAFAKTGKASDQLNTRYTKTAQGVSKATKGMSRNFGMAGVQVQQFVGQIQGGQSALLALSQQGADLGIVLGAAGLGSFIGIAATAFSFLLPILNDTKEEVEDLTDSLRELASQQQLTAEQAAILSEAEGRKVAESLTKRAELTKRLADLEKLAARQRGAVSTAGRGTEEQERYAQGLRETQAEQNKLQVALVLTNKAIEDGTKNIITYNNNIGDGAETSQKMQDRTDRVSESLTRQILALNESEKAAMEYATAQALNLKAGEKIPTTIQAQIDKLFELKQAQKDQAEQEKKNAEMARDMAAFRKKQQADQEKRTSTINNLEQEIILAQMKNTLANEEYEIKAAIMALGADATEPEIERITSLVTQMQQLRNEAALTGQSIDEAFRGVGLSAMDSFSQATANAIVEQESLDGAVQSVAKTFVTEMLAAVIRYWVGQAAAALAGNALVTSSTVAAAGISAAAWEPAAILASTATLGGAAGIGVSATVGALAAGKGASALMGAGRLNGGQVYPGMMHPVTEDGRPELLIQGGKQFLLPGSRGGEVVSNKDMGSASGGNMTVNMPMTFNGNVNQQQMRNMIFDNEDAIWSAVQQVNAKKGIM